MRASNYRKNLLINKNTWKFIWGGLAAVIVAGVIFFFTYYKVDSVEVMGSSHYSEEEVKEMILRGPLASNSVLAPLLYSKNSSEGIPFVDGFSVTQINRSTICISVKEKKPVGCIPYLDSFVYFDRNGIFIEGSKTRDESVPYFDGIQVNHVIMNEKLPIKGTTVLNTAVALSTIFQKNQMIPDHIQFDDNYQISLLYGDITVLLGKDKYLEDKMTRVLAILPMLTGEKGILHLENISENSTNINFEREVSEVTAETWTGGYDENGEFTGDGEYDENGRHVGPKPKTELDYALENWVGGYDEEGDYTGAGEYDSAGNYVGPAPTQETLDANGDWKGGYEEDGTYTGTGLYDREGNYAGEKPGGEVSGEGQPEGEDADDPQSEDSWENQENSGEEYGGYEEEDGNYDAEGNGYTPEDSYESQDDSY
ncbi:MAG: cell division septal protein [Eubacteriales bacterium]|nr:cell division septal protein [Eubacteriales bacterium]